MMKLSGRSPSGQWRPRLEGSAVPPANADAHKLVLQLRAGDEVAVALRDIAAGECLEPFTLRAREAIPLGHKVALQAVAAGAVLHRLGQPIGHAREAIAAGAHVHVHNLGCDQSLSTRAIGTRLSNAEMLPASQVPSFQGFRRADGRAGTRNYVGVLTSVNCSALVARMIADHFRDPAVLADFPGVDGVVALTHKSGCSVAEGSRSMGMLRRALGGYARHPNFAGILLVGLGCEDNQIASLMADEKLVEGPALRTLVMQDQGGTRSSIKAGIESVKEMLAGRVQRMARAHPRIGAGRRPAMWRLRQLLGHFRESGVGRGRRPARRLRRHGTAVRNAGNLWRRKSAAGTRRGPAGR